VLDVTDFQRNSSSLDSVICSITSTDQRLIV